MRSRNPDLCRTLPKVIGFCLSFSCSCDSPVTINFYLFLLVFTYSPKLEKQIHACSTDLPGSFSWKRKAHDTVTETRKIFTNEVSKTKLKLRYNNGLVSDQNLAAHKNRWRFLLGKDNQHLM